MFDPRIKCITLHVFIAGNDAEVKRLMVLVPSVSVVRGNVAQWKIRNPNLPIEQRFPKYEALTCAPLWREEKFAWIRDILLSPPLELQVTADDDSIRISPSASSLIHLLRSERFLPQQLAGLPYSLILVDTRTYSAEDASWTLQRVPGRSKMMDTAVMIDWLSDRACFFFMKLNSSELV